MSTDPRARFAAAIRADPPDLALCCLLLGAEVDRDLDLRPAFAELDRLAAAVDLDRPPAAALRAVLAGFTGDAQDYEDLRSSLLHEVLRRRAGLPILLSVVWLLVAQRCGMRADGIGLPGHFIVRVGDREAAEYVDPFAGGAAVDVSTAPSAYLRPWAADEILLRILTNIRVWAQRSAARAEAGLWAVELALLVPGAPADLMREHGALLVARGHCPDGAAQFEAYAEFIQAADPAAAEQARRRALAARAQLN